MVRSRPDQISRWPMVGGVAMVSLFVVLVRSGTSSGLLGIAGLISAAIVGLSKATTV